MGRVRRSRRGVWSTTTIISSHLCFFFIGWPCSASGDDLHDEHTSWHYRLASFSADGAVVLRFSSGALLVGRRRPQAPPPAIAPTGAGEDDGEERKGKKSSMSGREEGTATTTTGRVMATTNGSCGGEAMGQGDGAPPARTRGRRVQFLYILFFFCLHLKLSRRLAANLSKTAVQTTATGKGPFYPCTLFCCLPVLFQPLKRNRMGGVF